MQRKDFDNGHYWVNSRMIFDMVKVRTFIKMGIGMMANGNMESKKVLRDCIIPLVAHMKDNLQMEELMDTGNF